MLYIQQIIKKNIFQNKIDTPFKANIFHYTWWSLGRDQVKACERENFWFYFRENNDLWSYIGSQFHFTAELQSIWLLSWGGGGAPPTPYPPHPCHNVYKEIEQVSDVHLDKLGQGVNIMFVC